MTEFLPTRRALIAAAILSVVVAMLFLATRAATGIDTVPTDLPNIVEPAGQAHGSDVPAIPNVEPIPTTTTAPATDTTFSERLQDRADSGGGEYLPAPTIGLDLDAPATTVVEVIANVVESTTTTGPVVIAEPSPVPTGPVCESEDAIGCVVVDSVDQSDATVTDDRTTYSTCLLPDGETYRIDWVDGRSAIESVGDPSLIVADPIVCPVGAAG